MNLCELSGHRLEIFNVNLAHSFTKHHDVNSTDFISRRSIWTSPSKGQKNWSKTSMCAALASVSCRFKVDSWDSPLSYNYPKRAQSWSHCQARRDMQRCAAQHAAATRFSKAKWRDLRPWLEAPWWSRLRLTDQVDWFRRFSQTCPWWMLLPGTYAGHNTIYNKCSTQTFRRYTFIN